MQRVVSVQGARKKVIDLNKNINNTRFFMRNLPSIERKEHGLSSTPTKKQLPAMEMKEHGLKRKPSMSELMKMERKEHVKGNKVVVGEGYMGRAKAK